MKRCVDINTVRELHEAMDTVDVQMEPVFEGNTTRDTVRWSLNKNKANSSTAHPLSSARETAPPLVSNA